MNLGGVSVVLFTVVSLLLPFVCAAWTPVLQTPSAWTLDPARGMSWRGVPYLPVGWRVNAGEELSAALATGVKDVLIDATEPQAWTGAIAEAESAGAAYLLGGGSKSTGAPAFVIQPETYRVDKVPRRASYMVPVPNSQSAYYVLLTSQGLGIAKRGWAEVTNGSALIKVDEQVAGGSFVLLVYPRASETEYADLWEGFDSARDRLLAWLASQKFGPGLRGIVNPLGRVERWNSYRGGYVPDSDMFRLEFEDFLQRKYGDVSRLARAWKLRSPEILNFREAANLVALFSTTRGLDRLWHPETDRLYPVDHRTSGYWADVQAAIENSAARRAKRLVDAIQRIVDVPVFWEWSAWSPIHDSPSKIGDGVGMRAIGTGLDPLETYAAGAASCVAAQGGREWLAATDISGGPNGFTEERQLSNSLTDTLELGARGWFVRWQPSAVQWLKNVTPALLTSAASQPAPKALFYPENARHPANTQRLPGGVWWLPTPAAGNRIDYWIDYEGYRHVSRYATFTALWRPSGTANVLIRVQRPDQAKFLAHDGTPLDVRVKKDGVEVQLGPMPILLVGTEEVPVPADALEAVLEDYNFTVEQAKKLAIDVGELRFMFQDAARKEKDNPGAAFTEMVIHLRAMQERVAPFAWVEFEASQDTTFGEYTKDPACSGESAIANHSPMNPGNEGYYVKSRIRVKNNMGDPVLWIAADVPKAVRSHVVVEVGTSLTLRLPETPESGFGSGFGWYNLGPLALKPGSYDVTIRLLPTAPEWTAAFDCMLLTSVHFTPSGTRKPTWQSSRQ